MANQGFWNGLTAPSPDNFNAFLVQVGNYGAGSLSLPTAGQEGRTAFNRDNGILYRDTGDPSNTAGTNINGWEPMPWFIRIGTTLPLTNLFIGMAFFNSTDSTLHVNVDGTATGWRALAGSVSGMSSTPTRVLFSGSDLSDAPTPLFAGMGFYERSTSILWLNTDGTTTGWIQLTQPWFFSDDVIVISDGVITGIPVSDGGSGYTSPTVTISGGLGIGAAATATVSGGAVTAITISDGGSGYLSTPTVAITGGGGSGATATATVSSGVVIAITVTNGGSGFTSPTVAITGGGGSGATAVTSVANGAVTAITVTNGGAGYTSAPMVAITGGGGSGATASLFPAVSSANPDRFFLNESEAGLFKDTGTAWVRRYISPIIYRHFTTSGTLEIPSWVRWVRVEMIGGGGGGAFTREYTGTDAATFAVSRGGRGGGGLVGEFPVFLLGPSPVTVQVGAGGLGASAAAATTLASITGGSSRFANGQAGGLSSLGWLAVLGGAAGVGEMRRYSAGSSFSVFLTLTTFNAQKTNLTSTPIGTYPFAGWFDYIFHDNVTEFYGGNMFKGTVAHGTAHNVPSLPQHQDINHNGYLPFGIIGGQGGEWSFGIAQSGVLPTNYLIDGVDDWFTLSDAPSWMYRVGRGGQGRSWNPNANSGYRGATQQLRNGLSPGGGGGGYVERNGLTTSGLTAGNGASGEVRVWLW